MRKTCPWCSAPACACNAHVAHFLAPGSPVLPRIRPCKSYGRCPAEAAEPLQDAALIADVRDQLGLAIYSREFSGEQVCVGTPPALRTGVGSQASPRRPTRSGGVAVSRGPDLGKQEGPLGRGTAARARRATRKRSLSPRLAEFDIEASYAVRHLAGHKQDAGDLDGALAGFQRSLALRTKAGYHIYLAPALLAVGDLWKAERQRHRGARVLRAALAEANRLKAPSFQGIRRREALHGRWRRIPLPATR